MLKVEKISGKGRGTIAVQDIPQGTIIENAPVADFPPDQRATIHETEIGEYYFVRPTEYNLKNKHVSGYFVLGLSSLSNHSEEPNAQVEWYEDDLGLWARLTALRDIRTDEEVTVFYTNIDEYPVEEFV
ncbi:SET domain-containing protein-lysine N-methyltransferase [Desulfobulbus sp. TB]|nr:SET domain-containing protein-lysine N-methyltransferase [Desulfobulbus sp. TB]